MSVCQLGPEEEHILTSFTRRLIKIAADASAHGGTSTVDVLNTMLFPAIALERRRRRSDQTDRRSFNSHPTNKGRNSPHASSLLSIRSGQVARISKECIGRSHQEASAWQWRILVLGSVASGRTTVRATPEFRYSNDRRCDIWITFKNRTDNGLIILENKIDAPEGVGQLGSYETKARQWCNKYKGRCLLVYLTPHGRQTKLAKDRWVTLSYLDLASALREAWQKTPNAAGRPWLELYIAAITVGVVEIDINRPQDTPLGDIETYLGKAAPCPRK